MSERSKRYRVHQSPSWWGRLVVQVHNGEVWADVGEPVESYTAGQTKIRELEDRDREQARNSK